MKNFFHNLEAQLKALFKDAPTFTVLMFILSVVFMNLFANISLVWTEYFAADAGILLSWVAFLAMDMFCRRYGQKASNILSILAIIVNIIVVILFNIVALLARATPDLNSWAEGFITVLAGDWRVIISSTIALLVASLVQNATNASLTKLFKKGSKNRFSAYAFISYSSTIIGQIIDNLVFSLFAHYIFRIWGSPLSVVATFTFALLGAFVELVGEIIFSPLGFRISEKWRKQGRGNEYLQLLKQQKLAKITQIK